jgi:ABC-type multidrug transport system fused ATPase/permease subunit
MSEKKIWGVSKKAISVVCMIIGISSFLIFLIIPFIVATLVPIIFPDRVSEYEYLVDHIDGIALLVGILGTVASILSIVMTIIDKKRYSEEKKTTEQLLDSVTDMHKEISVVDDYVRRTFEQNQRMGLELYRNNIIKIDPNNAAIGVSTDSAYVTNQWNEKEDAREKID